jgi:cytochrome bd-type quinol oxidase subunit 2
METWPERLMDELYPYIGYFTMAVYNSVASRISQKILVIITLIELTLPLNYFIFSIDKNWCNKT